MEKLPNTIEKLLAKQKRIRYLSKKSLLKFLLFLSLVIICVGIVLLTTFLIVGGGI